MRTGWKRIRLLVLFPVVVLVLGTFGFMVLEGLSFTDAFYFTMVTISTVGYGDIYPTNSASKVFSIVLIIIGIGTFLTIVTNITQMLIQRGQNRIRVRRLNMIIGVFFTEVGNQLLHIFTQYDPQINEVRKDCLINQDCSETDFTHLKKQLQQHECAIDPKSMNLETLSQFLIQKGDLLLRQIENPDLIEHESFTDLLWAVVHLRDELMSRKSFLNLPEADLEHLANDAKRAYGALVKQWVDYLQHLKRSYPYLFSLALRTNPFSEKRTAVIE
ncbi:MAG: potassium channel family protein [Dehalococcoidales bacterium]